MYAIKVDDIKYPTISSRHCSKNIACKLFNIAIILAGFLITR